jgi:hypothetical protein
MMYQIKWEQVEEAKGEGPPANAKGHSVIFRTTASSHSTHDHDSHVSCVGRHFGKLGIARIACQCHVTCDAEIDQGDCTQTKNLSTIMYEDWPWPRKPEKRQPL